MRSFGRFRDNSRIVILSSDSSRVRYLPFSFSITLVDAGSGFPGATRLSNWYQKFNSVF